MSTQPQPQLQQQPVVVYPNTVSGQPAPVTHSHSNGSFGTVFIVLAVIIVISGIACCLGRFCSKRKSGGGGSKHGKPEKKSKHMQKNPNNFQVNPNFEVNPKILPREREEMRGRERAGGDVDLEFGFDKGFRPGNGDGRGHIKFNLPRNGHAKGGGAGDESYVLDGGNLKPGP
ncbi:hypothetical protein M5689_019508 [Euphorbia peplus]|nr:hypothetical protein M5689_019508 [Euphorbia peplus]